MIKLESNTNNYFDEEYVFYLLANTVGSRDKNKISNFFSNKIFYNTDDVIKKLQRS